MACAEAFGAAQYSIGDGDIPSIVQKKPILENTYWAERREEEENDRMMDMSVFDVL